MSQKSADWTRLDNAAKIFPPTSNKQDTKVFRFACQLNEWVEQDILQQATDYVYIATPYLVVDNEMITTLSLIAKSGVDVRIITPGIPDKKYVYWVTQSYYSVLMKAGVRIFEYSPGFIHAKMYVSDDKTAVVGSANMDYRSLYLHFENCCVFYGGRMVQDVHADLVRCMQVSHEVTWEDVKNVSLPKRAFRVLLRLFAPLL